MSVGPSPITKHSIYALLFLALFTTTSFAQIDLPLEEGVTGLHQTLRQLQTTASVLHIVAHPDDEDGAMMCYCARGLGARTMLFSITRGEGGANLISKHFFDELGALRTLEHIKAAQYYGSRLFYSSATDYGYSKNLEEANRTWNNGDRILEELVHIIRREKPLFLFSRFRGNPRDGHGHHQMAGVLARKAFRAAGDSKQFPKQLEEQGLHPWQPLKLYVTSRAPAEGSDDGILTMPVGKYDPVLGRSYAQIARFGLGFQRSQGISGHIGEAGERNAYYRLVEVANGVTRNEETLPTDNVDVSIQSIGTMYNPQQKTPDTFQEKAKKLQTLIESAVDTFDINAPDKITQQLITALAHLDSMSIPNEASDAHKQLIADRLSQKRQQLVRAIQLAAGIQFEAKVDVENQQSFLSAIDPYTVNNSIVVRSDVPVKLIEFGHTTMRRELNGRRTRLNDPAYVFVPQEVKGRRLNQNLNPNQPHEEETKVTSKTPTRPHWSRASIREPFYTTQPFPNDVGDPMPTSQIESFANLEIYGTTLRIATSPTLSVRHPLYGNVRYAAQVTPPVSISFPLREGVFPADRDEYTINVVLRTMHESTSSGQVKLEGPDGWKIEPKFHTFSGERKADEETQYRFVVGRPESNQNDTATFKAVAIIDGEGAGYREGITTVTARDLERINIYRAAEHIVHNVDAKVLGDPNVAYISGSGDQVAESLAMLDIRPAMLAESDLASSDLNQHDVILIGVRAYAVREDIKKHNARLLKFVEDGGTLIVQYQTPEFDNNYGPFPYTQGRRPEEVSEEDATVTILVPDHPLLSRPNKITTADFDDWLEQRGSKFLTTWDDKYKPLLSCHDSGQEPQRGGLVVARHGKGVYVYSAYAWYRQLPNGVPGAFRLMANHLSLPTTMAK